MSGSRIGADFAAVPPADDASDSRRSPRLRRRGFIVVAVLWLLAALAALASVASFYVAQSAVALSVVDEPTESEAVITAALELTAYQLSSRAVKPTPTHGAFGFRLGRAEARVEYMSEAARIDLNSAGKGLLAGLFGALGASADDASSYADRIMAWRTPLKPNVEDEEAEVYRAADLAYGPGHKPFDSVEELWLVAGLPPNLVRRALPFVTVYTLSNAVNILDAAPEVIAALPGMTPGRLDAFLSQRAAGLSSPTALLESLGERQVGAGIRGSDTYRVRMRIVYANGRIGAPEIVIKLGGSGAKAGPFTVLSWRDGIDPITGGPLLPGDNR